MIYIYIYIYIFIYFLYIAKQNLIGRKGIHWKKILNLADTHKSGFYLEGCAQTAAVGDPVELVGLLFFLFS